VFSFLAAGLLCCVRSGEDGARGAAEKSVVRVGTKNFTEQFILGEFMAQMIEDRTDLAVERLFNLGGTMICHGALVKGEIDLYAEYTGTGLTAVLHREALASPEAAYEAVAAAYRKNFGCEWLRPFGFNNTYTITVRRADAEANGWRTISDLREVSPSLRAGFTAEFFERPDGYPGLRAAYGFGFGSARDLDPGLTYRAVARHEVDLINGFATDGRIPAYDLVPLGDDREFFPPYNAAPVVRRSALEAHPELREALGALAGIADDAAMQRLNYEVDEKKRAPADVAREFLEAKGLLGETEEE
jgi:glycine betaine/choline ABC-type transport system substrate-binding protein